MSDQPLKSPISNPPPPILPPPPGQPPPTEPTPTVVEVPPVKQSNPLFANWKTTVAGILSAFMAMTGPLSGFLAAIQAMKSTPDYRLALWGAGLTAAAAVARAWIGLIQSDAKPSVTSSLTIEAVTPAPPAKEKP